MPSNNPTVKTPKQSPEDPRVAVSSDGINWTWHLWGDVEIDPETFWYRGGILHLPGPAARIIAGFFT
jgi:hypothetical protein